MVENMVWAIIVSTFPIEHFPFCRFVDCAIWIFATQPNANEPIRMQSKPDTREKDRERENTDTQCLVSVHHFYVYFSISTWQNIMQNVDILSFSRLPGLCFNHFFFSFPRNQSETTSNNIKPYLNFHANQKFRHFHTHTRNSGTNNGKTKKFE